MQAIILAGGRGERMMPFTEKFPKPMVPIDGVPLIDYQLNQIKRNGITNIAIYESYLAEVIEEYLGDGSRLGVNIEHRSRPFEHGSLGCINDALKKLPDDQNDLLVMYGDNFSNIDLREMIDQHHQFRSYGTLATLEQQEPYGVVAAEGRGILSFEEKPVRHKVLGVYVVAKELIRHIPRRGDFSRDGLQPMINKNFEFHRFGHHGYWWDVASTDIVEEIEREIREGDIDLEGVNKPSSPEGFLPPTLPPMAKR